MFRPLGPQPPEGPTTRVVVDGETCEIETRPGRPGQYHLDWVSGPNAGYGFSIAHQQWTDGGHSGA